MTEDDVEWCDGNGWEDDVGERTESGERKLFTADGTTAAALENR
jgi:hypothetical protein